MILVVLLLLLAMNALSDVYEKDWQSPESIVAALYETISADPHQPRDWQRFRLLFAEHCYFSMIIDTNGHQVIVSQNVEDMIALTEKYYQSIGFHEIETGHRLELHGQFASVYSRFQIKRQLSDKAAIMKGLNHFQLLFDGKRWWVISNVSVIDE